MLERLDDLIWFANRAAYLADWILDCYAMDRSCHQRAHKRKRLFLLLGLVFPPPGSTDGQVRARRVKNCQVPSIGKQRNDVSLDMERRPVLTFQKVA